MNANECPVLVMNSPWVSPTEGMTYGDEYGQEKATQN